MKTQRINSTQDELTSCQDLKVGEMMDHAGEIILRFYNGFINLNNPNARWSDNADLLGRKLKPGEGISLIQE